MESAEAILENENNSNVESESYIRQQQQLSLQNAAIAQGEQDGQPEMDVGSGSKEPEAEPVVLKNSQIEHNDISTVQDLTDDKDVAMENEINNGDKSNTVSNESMNCEQGNENNESQDNMLDNDENELRPVVSNTAETELQLHSEEESALRNELATSVDESKSEDQVAMQNEDSELLNDKDEGAQEKDLDNESPNDERAEESLHKEENMEKDRDTGSSNLSLHTDIEQDNSEPPDLQPESVGDSETLLQFSPLGDNDLAPVTENVGDSQSCSSAKENNDSTTDSTDAYVDNQKMSNDNMNSPEKEIISNTESQQDDLMLSENSESIMLSENSESSSGIVEKEKEIESNSTEEPSAAESLTVSQEDEKCLLDDDDVTNDNKNQALDDKNDDLEMEEESKEDDEKLDDGSQNLISGKEAETEMMEVESSNSFENLSSEVTASEKLDNTTQSSVEKEEREMDVESAGVMMEDDENSCKSQGESVDNTNNMQSDEEKSQNSVMPQNESEAVADNDSEVEVSPESELVKEGGVSTADESLLDEEDMEIGSKDSLRNDSSGNGEKTRAVDEIQVEKPSEATENMDSVSEVVQNVDKLSELAEKVEKNQEKNDDELENGKQSSSEAVENEEKSPKAVEHESPNEMTEKSPEAVEIVEKSPKAVENTNEVTEKSTEATESSDDTLKELSKSEESNMRNSDNESRSDKSDCAEITPLEKSVSNDVEMIEENGINNSSSECLEKEAVVNEVMPAADIKKEVAETQVENKETPLSVSSKELKKEIINDDDDIVILDDDDDDGPVTVKKEAVEDKGKDASNSGIQIATISGHDYKLHSNAISSSKESDDKAEKLGKSKTQKCIVCQKVTKCKFNIVRGGDTKQLCDDVCFKKFRKSPTKFLSKPPAADQSKAKFPPIQPKSGMLVVNLGDTPTSGSVAAPALTSLLSASPKQQQQQIQLQQSQLQKQQQQQQQQQPNYKTCTVCQVINVQAPQTFCNWKGFDFCGEICLGKFQSTLRANCSNCFVFIPNEMRASYCAKIGNIMHPFCKQKCVSDFIKKLKTCTCCKEDLSTVNVVIARVGADDRPKEFCSQTCVKKFQDQVEDVEIVHVEPGQGSSLSTCSVCKSHSNSVKHTVRFHSKTFKLCSDLCLSAFQYTNKINLNKCSTCGNMCTAAQSQPFFIQFEGETKRFCSDRCIGTFRLDNRKLASCTWCAARKINFDMIERQDENNKYQLFCSLNCLSLFRVNLQAKSNQAVECDRCRKIVPAQYHLTMSDASVRNFCSYACVMGFQSQFTARIAPPLPPLGGTTGVTTALTTVPHKKNVQAPTASLAMAQQPPPTPPAAPAPPAPHPHGTRNRGRRGSKGAPKTPQPTTKTPQPTTSNASTSIPVISNVVSLAPEDVPQDTVTGAQLQEKAVATLLKTLEKKGVMVSGDGKQRLVVEAPIPKLMKNKALQCKPICQTKATACRPHSQHKDCQTDEHMGKPVIIPIPVPIYIPMPTVMYQAPAPVPVPFPVPIPVPIFIPTTRKSANGIIKTIKEIQERMPADPLEAEILMMAEAVATDKRTAGDSDSDSEVEGDTGFEAPVVSDDGDAKMDVPEKEGERRAEDMIQMALRMAEEMTGPMEDLEASVQPVAVNSISGQVVKQDQQAMMPNTSYQQQEEDPDYMPVKSGRGRGSKRASRGRPVNSRSKRQRTGRNYAEPEMEPEEQTPPPPRVEISEPPPDTNYKLKFTYGVNAWKHWVVIKNSELETASKTNPKVRLLPIDVLKCTMDELHFSLCLFIKEVRKPNGEPYSPDSIYYLCLGIQQYLYENGRIDNIFTDLYFQRFTDSLHDVLKALQPKVNSQGQMLCRIEEEHLWESKQLGAHSPYVLLNTLIYFHTKHFILKTAADHMSLSFAQILKHWKKGVPLKGNSAAPKNASLRFYCLANNKKQDASARKAKEGGVPVYEVTENFDNPLRCPVKLYEFFLSKCPESIKNRNDIFYPVPERSCVPDSPVWYSTQSIEHHTMDKMLTRILLVREIQESHLHAQPTYIKM